MCCILYDFLVNFCNKFCHFSATVLTDEAEGETPMIPADIMEYSISQVQNVDIDTTLKVLASPGNRLCDIPDSDQVTDPVVR